jgi:hypothetical protein
MKLMKIIVALLTLWACPTWGASIGFFSDPGCSSCNLRILAPPGMGILYITAVNVSSAPLLCGATGTLGAEFRVEGLPTGWIAQATPNPVAQASLGDPSSGEPTSRSTHLKPAIACSSTR